MVLHSLFLGQQQLPQHLLNNNLMPAYMHHVLKLVHNTDTLLQGAMEAWLVS